MEILLLNCLTHMRGPHYISQECQEKRREDCNGYVPRGYDEPYDHPCEDECHKPSCRKE
jgi:hypothetical protein